MESRRKVPSLVELCRDTAILNLRFMGDVGDTELHLLKDILPRCNIKELTHIEYSSEGRDLSPVTDDLWKRFYLRYFGEKNANTVINRMKQNKVVFKWRELYEAKEKELDEVINRTVKKINAEIQHRNQWNLQFQSCSEDPLSEKKRGHGEGIGPSNMKSNLMKKAKLEYRNSHEVKIHALQPNRLSHQSIPKQNNILQSSPDSSSRNGKPAARK